MQCGVERKVCVRIGSGGMRGRTSREGRAIREGRRTNS